MSTKSFYSLNEIRDNNAFLSRTRSIIETCFYGNNVIEITSLKQAYELAKNSPGTIVLNQKVFEAEKLGLNKDSNVLLFNDGSITGRYAAARRIQGDINVQTNKLDKILMDAVYDSRYKKLYHAMAYVGLDKEFMVKAHLLIPEGHENILYNWLLNFQYINEEYKQMYENSKPLGNEPDIFIFSDPDWKGTNQTDVCEGNCLSYIAPNSNCAAILGMKYFGEHKKGTLTLAWAIASRNGYACCHGGQKEFILENNKKFVASVYGLSGSGKSTLTHAKHNGKYKVSVLHDDAFIINVDTCSSIALEPSYFDKTADYSTCSSENKYLVTVQNCGATKDEFGNIVFVSDDIRNDNGRSIKSKLWSSNRVDKIDSKLNAIFWIMKDPTLPPIIKLTNPSLASVMGATLATKRSSAERLAPGIDMSALVIEPYANPFRTYPLSSDYEKFKKLVEEKSVDCYVINTGDFIGKNIPKDLTLKIIEDIVEEKATFKKWGPFNHISVYEFDGYVANFKDLNYVSMLKDRIQDRINFVKSRVGLDVLPNEALFALESLIDELNKL